MWKKSLLKKSLTALLCGSMLAASLTACSAPKSEGSAGTTAKEATQGGEKEENVKTESDGAVTIKVANNQPLASVDRYAGFGIEQIKMWIRDRGDGEEGHGRGGQAQRAAERS